MNKFINSLVSITAILLATNVSAEPYERGLKVACDTLPKMVEFLRKEGEVPILVSDVFETPGHKLTIWVSTSGAISVTQSDKTYMCLLGAGENAIVVPGAVDKLKSQRRL